MYAGLLATTGAVKGGIGATKLGREWRSATLRFVPTYSGHPDPTVGEVNFYNYTFNTYAPRTQ